MLYLVLVLVIAAFGLLVAALTTANTIWAWISVAVSVIAAGLLIFDWLRGRRRVATTSASRPAGIGPHTVDATADYPPPVPPAERADPVDSPPPPPSEPAAQAPTFASGEPEPAPAPAALDGDEPDEEATDATDLLIISELTVEIRVVDEHPRYHLAECRWLSGRPTIPLPVCEARQLGFTPCARCGPDALLAARHRAGSART